ncbi:hypothetical protein AVEN_136924-1 [Araneus ventricosus]|uniref:Uncharacterized protein n=1 Tax=Araneus ventricosus TaxID=182803 RepID=A0A4Y2BJU3_ARAVE|nr:hypothetical protein AVEN_136924-1 [Araneus ventricosus]
MRQEEIEWNFKARIHLQVKGFTNRSRAFQRNCFHNEPTANHGKGANPPRTISHRLSVDNGGKGSLWKRLDLRLGLEIQPCRFAGNGILHSNASKRELRISLLLPRNGQDVGSQTACVEPKASSESSRTVQLASLFASLQIMISVLDSSRKC